MLKTNKKVDRDPCFRTGTCAPKDQSRACAGTARHFVTKCCCDERTSPTGIARRNRPIEHSENTLAGLGRVFRLGATIAGLIKSGQPIGSVAHAPLRRRARRASKLSANSTAGMARRCKRNDPRALLAQPVFGLGGTHQSLELGSFRLRQYRDRLRVAGHAP
jgi:hypothetical protein